MITYELLEISKTIMYTKCSSRATHTKKKKKTKTKSQNPLNVCHEITCGVDLGFKVDPPKSFGTKA